MRGVEEFRGLKAEATEWRHHLHQNPELDYRVHKTAGFVAEKLASFGINHIETGIAETGVVAVIEGEGGEGPTIGLRADMDALPIHEASQKPWSSLVEGKMHACGHDGHTAMLLGAAKYLAGTRKFRGSVALIFQPAEEDGQGADRMVREGLMDRFGISQVYGMHNMPGIEVGKFGLRDGTMMAALDEFDIIVKGRGGHAATPHKAIDPVVICAQIILGLQTLVSRYTDATEALVISVTRINASEGYHIISDSVAMGGTVRSVSPALRDFAEKQIKNCAENIARAYGAEVEFRHRRLEPLTFNHTVGTRAAVAAARGVVGEDSVDHNTKPVMVSEDFSYMLNARPGAFIFLGNGATAGLHHPAYDFDDEAIPFGIGYWVNLVETTLAV
ncbi:MAG: amidohydrolase [Mesorhizobium sp.]|uniref:M20 aminoacylase family protein n=1 Tax=Mesorhizobium sp. TaxID=1871066 RepID=UPI000FE86306|nr:M20 aminoacylase family protein [Mesorhizobium sp.]RWD45516.1 MAG: amidohydrolase [Mesorhizobium sp.]RWE51967.1 MAG: amidohydrolase [Mesorhizobium sp.]RWF07084.1 MAG: amidohydrolase [Mesorhizobium sp.]RWF19384.1 MAG: amidohydrolase [Mesorhizobium sp.]TIY03868.1 MAG: amidohydrolase [Mesorhizobium sp.]